MVNLKLFLMFAAQYLTFNIEQWLGTYLCIKRFLLHTFRPIRIEYWVRPWYKMFNKNIGLSLFFLTCMLWLKLLHVLQHPSTVSTFTTGFQT